MIQIQSQLIGQPQTITDERGSWRSAIFRQPVTEPIMLQSSGLVGDKVADTRHHGSPDQAVCCHPATHYDFWNQFYGLEGEAKLGPGSVGENWTLSNATEATIAIGDIFDLGEAIVQVSAPRFPCQKQERKLQLPNFLKEVMSTMRTGFYVRVIMPGNVQVGDELRLVERPFPNFTVQLINEQTLGTPNPAIAKEILALPPLAEGWKRILEGKLKRKM